MRGAVLAVVAISILVAAGCGDSLVTVYSVKGKLTKGGQPFGDVHLDLSPTSEGNHSFASADVGPDGSFELKCSDGRLGAPAGTYKVVLAEKVGSAEDAMEGMKAMRAKMEGKGGKMDPGKMAGGGEKFPASYRNKDKSPKTVEVKAEDQTLDIDII